MTEIVSVNISVNAVTTARQGFGNMLFLGENNLIPETVRTYNSLNEVLEDTIVSGNADFVAASTAYFSNTPAPKTLKLASTGSITTSIDVSGLVGTVNATYAACTVNGTVVTLDLDGTEISTAIATELETAINTVLVGSASVSGDVVTFTPTVETDTISQFGSDLTVTYGAFDLSGTNVADLIARINVSDSDWYVMAANNHTYDFVSAFSSIVTALEGGRLYFTSSAEEDTLNTSQNASNTDTFGKLRNDQADRVIGLWHDQADTLFPECAFFGYNASADAGSTTWNALRLNIPIPVDPTTGKYLSATQINNIENRNANYMETRGGKTYTRNGLDFTGEWIDVWRGLDALTDEVTASVLDLLLSQKGTKLPFTDTGIQAVRAKVDTALSQFAPDFITQDYRVTVPKRSDISTADVAARILRDVKFTATLTSAIHVVEVQGTLTL